MSAKARNDLIVKLHKYCKKENPVVLPPSNRTVLEHMLYGCCLENSTCDAADEAFAKLQENFFDWNEVRVTTASELAELMKRLTYPKAAALSIKKTLHGVFECYYQFDLEFLRKENLSKAVSQFEKFKGVTPFVVSYVAQHGLGGHSIPLDRSMMLLFYTLGIATEEEATSGHVPGLERTIPKAKGIEFSSVVHPLAVAFNASPFNTKLREQLLKINKDAKELFPKRGAKPKSTTEPETELEPAAAEDLPVAEEKQSKPSGSGKAKEKLVANSASKSLAKSTTKPTAKSATKSATKPAEKSATAPRLPAKKKTTKPPASVKKKPSSTAAKTKPVPKKKRTPIKKK